MRVTIFAPHPDDDLIGCGGSLVKWVQTGAEVSIVYLTSGDLPITGFTHAEITTLREKEATAASKLLGVTHLEFLREPDGALADSPVLVGKLVHQIRLRRPNVVYIPHALDDHPDHLATHRLLRRAIQDAAGPYWPETGQDPWKGDLTLGYEVWTPLQHPTYFEDTTNVIDEQLRALAEHRSQVVQVPYESFVRGLGLYWGARLGHGRFAEAFEVLGLGEMPGLSS